MRLEALPAAHGDALLVTWGTAAEPFRMLVDAGPATTYPNVHDRLAALDRASGVDVLVVTHVDADHIDGVVQLLRDRPAMGLRLGDVWFNGWPQLSARTRDDALGADLGEMAGALLRRGKQPWNVAFGEAAAAVPAAGPLPVIDLPGELRVTVLAPGDAELDALHRNWVKVCADAHVTPGDIEGALQRLDKRARLRGVEPEVPPPDVLGPAAKLDNSVANGSSISLLLERPGSSLLLTGDGHGPVLTNALRRLLGERGEPRLRVDAVKLPHHGSAANVTDDFLALVETSRYVVSTSGARYRHPDEAALLRIVDGPARGDEVELVFNYRSVTTEPWDAADRKARYDYVATYPDDPAAGAVVEV